MKRYIVITEASSGIGCEAAKVFAARGENIIVVARRLDKLEKLKKEIQNKSPKVDMIIKTTDLSILDNVYNLYGELKKYNLKALINNAGFGNYETVAEQNLHKIEKMICLNIGALTILSSLFVRDYANVEGTQLINISSCGGYTIVPTAVTYCATKYYVSAFTEGLAHELIDSKIKVKVLAPAATKAEFGKLANNVNEYNYDKAFGKYHTAEQMAGFLIQLYDNDMTVGIVDRESFEFKLCKPIFNYAGNSNHNQKQGA